ncbi:putative 60s ribosomal protein l13 [Zalerion maritima]|uniref:60S ribosomal protein L13 n=1 Tax=Zalerion maritima TaxID=339359 RepID=A0AAD5RT55_9PEZI|nr:putative 60s ribosomal protein l13 [Zalerion maritima]
MISGWSNKQNILAKGLQHLENFHTPKPRSTTDDDTLNNPRLDHQADTMAIKHNNQLPNNHFRKDWQRRVRCHFDQPGKKLRRRNARQVKAAALAPRPVDKLRPIVRCPTIKYNRRARAGRGFSLAELKAAGISRRVAPTIGISVDWRRANISEEGLATNVARLKEYKTRLIVFPRKSNKAKTGDSSKEDLAAEIVSTISSALPIVAADKTIQEINSKDMPAAQEDGAYRTLRMARANKKNEGKRQKRASAKAEAEQSKK